MGFGTLLAFVFLSLQSTKLPHIATNVSVFHSGLCTQEVDDCCVLFLFDTLSPNHHLGLGCFVASLLHYLRSVPIKRNHKALHAQKFL